ncbi:DoxX family protein [Gephyromycinifex aptenodytis]|uniref:DoxX family protein n=1 Tax=Gephyromycinifex aptenodytis TaxID=2716227 RepID=UPI0014482F9C|nr:hypothetical protein [Gephyromycinifex aptenodytis]
MAPLIVLLTVTALARAIGACDVEYVASWPEALAVGLSAMFIVTAVAHFDPTRRPGLISIVPPVIPAPGLWVSLTGVLELMGAAGLLVPAGHGPVRALAAWCLAALLVAMFPANVYAATAKRSPTAPHTPLVPRTAIQGVFLLAAIIVASTG